MLGPERVQELATQVLGFSKAEQTEVVIQGTDSALTRFANSAIHQNVAETNIQVRVRLVIGKRTGVATTNDLSADALKQTVEIARVMAQLQRENAGTPSLPGPQAISRVEGYVERTAGFSPEARARAVAAICKKARGSRLVAAGAFRTTTRELAVANSLGVWAYYPSTTADLQAVMMTEESSGYASAADMDAEALDPERVAEQAATRALRGRNPQVIEPGDYTVLLEEPAVSDLLRMAGQGAFHALAVQENRSFMRGRTGQPVMAENVTIWDDGLSPQTFPQPFDYEGVPKAELVLVKQGIAQGVVYDSTTAAREGKRSTGHALPMPNAAGPLPQNLFLAPGPVSRANLARGIERGILVTRVWYTRLVHPMRLVVTGTTRDGTFLVEGGEITRPLCNMRFTTSYLEALNRVQAIASETRLEYSAAHDMCTRVPAVVVGGFHFTGVAKQ